MQRTLASLVVLALAACAGSKLPSFCDGPTKFDYDPSSPGADLEAFPDDFFTTPDAKSLTGLKVRVELSNAPWLQALPPIQTDAYTALNSLDGFGTSAGVIVRFTDVLGPTPSGEAESLASKAVMLVDLGPGGPTRIPFQTELTDDGAGMILWPMRPLRPKTLHAVVVTTAQHDARGQCIAPSDAMKALLSNENVPAALLPIEPKIAAALKALKLAPGDVSAAAAFTTESLYEDTLTAAKDIESRTYAWKQAPSRLSSTSSFIRYRGVFTAEDYRKDGVVVDGTPQATYDLPVALWEPKTPGPWPVLVFGHGLGASKEQAEVVAEIVAPLGVETVAIDAPDHGEHPTAPKGDDPTGAVSVFNFFGVDGKTGGLDTLVLRDHFREATYDKLQLLKLLRDTANTDAGPLDVDTSRVAYVGYSLGGMMGSELLASAKGLGLAALFVPGARISTIASEGANFSLLAEALQTPEDPGSADRFFAVLQAALDRGDPANWAPHVLTNRFDDGVAPHLMVGEVIDDDTMPNTATEALARALGVPQLPPIIQPIDAVTPLASAPVSGNLDGLTAALFQFDRITFNATSAPVHAEHQTILDGRESQLMLQHFVATWLSSPAPELIDPYATLHTPPLGR